MPNPSPLYSKEVNGRFYTVNSEGAVSFPSIAKELWRIGDDSKRVETIALKNALAVVPEGYSWAALGMVRSAFKDICRKVDQRVRDIATEPLGEYRPFGAFRSARTSRYSGMRGGQRLSIPAGVRSEWGVGAGDKVAFALLGNIALITPEYAAPYTKEQASKYITETWFNLPKADALRAMASVLPDAYKAWCIEVGDFMVNAMSVSGETTEVNSYLYPDNSLLGRAMSRTIINDLLDGAKIANSAE